MWFAFFHNYCTFSLFFSAQVVVVGILLSICILYYAAFCAFQNGTLMQIKTNGQIVWKCAKYRKGGI